MLLACGMQTEYVGLSTHAHAAGCYGSQCTSYGPSGMGCLNNQLSRGTYYIFDQNGTEVLHGWRWTSPSCNATWSDEYNPSPGIVHAACPKVEQRDPNNGNLVSTQYDGVNGCWVWLSPGQRERSLMIGENGYVGPFYHYDACGAIDYIQTYACTYIGGM